MCSATTTTHCTYSVAASTMWEMLYAIYGVSKESRAACELVAEKCKAPNGEKYIRESHVQSVKRVGWH